MFDSRLAPESKKLLIDVGSLVLPEINYLPVRINNTMLEYASLTLHFYRWTNSNRYLPL